jgi:hypothetical protein
MFIPQSLRAKRSNPDVKSRNHWIVLGMDARMPAWPWHRTRPRAGRCFAIHGWLSDDQAPQGAQAEPVSYYETPTDFASFVLLGDGMT